MIILIGPDATGKTTLAKKISEECSKPYHHFTKDSKYIDYIRPLVKLEFTDAITDRWAICEYPYSIVMNRQFSLSIKQWHNILLMTLIHDPLIILCTHKPEEEDYDIGQYLPYSLWDDCLARYKSFLNANQIDYTELDYAEGYDLDQIILEESRRISGMSWWRDHWRSGYGCASSSNPTYLLIAERMGPNNRLNIPFETGPTGHMLSEVLLKSKTPLGKFTITNMIKQERGKDRKLSDSDFELLSVELVNLKPKKLILMGAVSKAAISLAKQFDIDYESIIHLGALNHKGISDVTGYSNEWRKVLGLVPMLTFE